MLNRFSWTREISHADYQCSWILNTMHLLRTLQLQNTQELKKAKENLEKTHHTQIKVVSHRNQLLLYVLRRKKKVEDTTQRRKFLFASNNLLAEGCFLNFVAAKKKVTHRSANRASFLTKGIFVEKRQNLREKKTNIAVRFSFVFLFWWKIASIVPEKRSRHSLVFDLRQRYLIWHCQFLNSSCRPQNSEKCGKQKRCEPGTRGRGSFCNK